MRSGERLALIYTAWPLTRTIPDVDLTTLKLFVLRSRGLQILQSRCGKNWVYLGVKTCEVFLCFVTIMFVLSFVLTSLPLLCFLCSTSLVKVIGFYTEDELKNSHSGSTSPYKSSSASARSSRFRLCCKDFAKISNISNWFTKPSTAAHIHRFARWFLDHLTWPLKHGRFCKLILTGACFSIPGTLSMGKLTLNRPSLQSLICNLPYFGRHVTSPNQGLPTGLNNVCACAALSCQQSKFSAPTRCVVRFMCLKTRNDEETWENVFYFCAKMSIFTPAP